MNIPQALSGILGVVVLLGGVEFTADGTPPPPGIPFVPIGRATLPQPQATYMTVTNQPYQNFGDWSTPVNVGAPINTEYNDNYAVLSRDELTIHFTSDRPGSVGGDDLWVSRRESTDSPWSTPVNLTALNTPFADSLAVLDYSEHVMYFHSARPGDACGLGDIWRSRRTNRNQDDWSAPENLGCVLNTPAVEIAPAFFVDPETDRASLYFGSNRPGGIGDFDIYHSTLLEDGTFGPGLLVPEVSSPARDTRTFVRRDGREVFITSDRPGGTGLLDIWVSTRERSSDPWSVPTNLGAVVNSSSDDGSPFLSWGGTRLYFFSTRLGGYGRRDIWLTTQTGHGARADVRFGPSRSTLRVPHQRAGLELRGMR